ncbi:MAG: UDP-4-amino-4,6-dideoxy-N-acetyl-beta-L-altrosamine transaminase [Endozoicomonadaceae bacterium]|nr:UDP-4-amino-4,6-dideoxy-N-acetyl-beta-L-altrosamine transaminase [Endozoicomonadaceae bacterium]
MIPYGFQDITIQDIDAVTAVLKSNFLTQGPVIPSFEKAITNKCKVNYAVAVNSATSALHLACLALGLGKDDVLWTTPITFVASANCALYCGATVDFVDIDAKTYNLCPEKLEKKLELVSTSGGKLPAVVVPVHLSGQSCNMEKLHTLSVRYGFKIIEDASHAIGAKYKNKPVGNCQYSDITVFSFHPVKIITTGEGGVAVTNDKKLADKMRLLRSHGITRDPELMTHEPHGPWYYQQTDLGFNYRMTDIQAALGLSQLERLDKYIDKRQSLASQYDKLLAELPVTRPYQHPDSYSSYHLYIIRLQPDKTRASHPKVFSFLRKQGIGVNLHYIPVHTQPYYQQAGFSYGDFPEAEKYYTEAISLPLFPKIKPEEQTYIVNTLKQVLST